MTYINQIAIKDGDGSTVADVRTDGTNNALVTVQNTTKYYSNNFVTTGAGTTQDVTLMPVKSYSMQCIGVGATATSWAVSLEISLDGANWTTILSHATATGNGTTTFNGISYYPARYFRANVTALTLGTATALTVAILGA